MKKKILASYTTDPKWTPPNLTRDLSGEPFVKTANNNTYVCIVIYCYEGGGGVSSRIRCRTRHPEYFEYQSSIPFELDKVNIGGVMNSSSGVFTAPRNGRYFFSLSGVAKFASNSTGYIGVA